MYEAEGGLEKLLSSYLEIERKGGDREAFLIYLALANLSGLLHLLAYRMGVKFVAPRAENAPDSASQHGSEPENSPRNSSSSSSSSSPSPSSSASTAHFPLPLLGLLSSMLSPRENENPPQQPISGPKEGE